ncbi:MAG TPA: translation initiation factor IF-3 [Candidatus Limnocylindria bacterium]
MAELRVNDQIRVPTVRLVGADGQQLGVVPTPRALALAQSEGYDLIEVAPTAVPPVCRIGDYGKLRYETQQREREAKKKQKTITWKEVRIAPKIDEHDLDTKIKTATRLLGHGDKLKLVVRFRGRELAHPERGRVLLMLMADRLKDVAMIERPPLLEGRQMIMVMNPVRPGQMPAQPAPTPGQPAAAAPQPTTAPASAPRPAPAPVTPRPAAAPTPAAPRVAPAARPAPPAPAPRTAAPRPAATRTQRT